MAKTPENLRNCSLEELLSLRGSTSPLVYAEMIKKTLKGRELSNLRNRFLPGKVSDHSKESKMQEELLGFLNNDLEDIQKDIKLADAFVAEKEKEWKKAKEELERVQAKFQKADEALRAAKAVAQKCHDDKDSIEESIRSSEVRQNNIDTLVLVHRSASIGQIADCCLGKIIITEADAKFMNGLLTADEVFDSSLAEGLMNGLPYNFQGLTRKTQTSIKQFVEMAMYYILLGEKRVVMLYANNDIAQTLKTEGV